MSAKKADEQQVVEEEATEETTAVAVVDEEESTELTVFQQHGVPDTVATKLLEVFPDFLEKSLEDQIDLITFMVEQAEVTTQQVRSRFPVVKAKHAGVNKIEIPAPVGESERPLVSEIECIMVYQYLTKAYWEKEVSEGGGGAPDCASTDAITPYTKDPKSDTCVTCDMNRFGTRKKGRGKACRDIKRLILIMEGHELPLRLSVSAANIGRLDQYLSDLKDVGLPLGTMITQIRAIKAQNTDNVEFTGLEFSTKRQLTGEEIQRVMAIKRAYEQEFRIGGIERDEAGGDDGVAPDPNQRASQASKAKAADVM